MFSVNDLAIQVWFIWPAAACEIAIKGLEEIWGADVRKHVVDTRVTQWGNNELVKGGYSRVHIGHHDVREKLAEPIGGVIFPAGEGIGACSPESGRNWATHMAGAALSGERAARLVLQEIEKERAENAPAFADPALKRTVLNR